MDNTPEATAISRYATVKRAYDLNQERLRELALQRHLFTSACIFTGPKSWLSRPLYTACDGQDTLCGYAAGSAVSVPAPPAA